MNEKVADPTQRRLLHRTHFKRGLANNRGWQWFWSKQYPNGQIIADGGAGYNILRSAIRGFFASEGVVYTYGGPPPENYVIQKFAEDHWVITKYGNQGESQQDSGE